MAAELTGAPAEGAAPSRGRDPDYPLVGETLGLWRLTGGLGRGGMGEVYDAEYDYLHLLTLRYPPKERALIKQELAALPREEQAQMASEMIGSPLPAEARFALKICNARRGTAGHRRFLQEAELAERLGQHPYIVTVHAIHRGADEEEGAEGDTRRLALDTGKHKDLAFMVMELARGDYDHTKLELVQAVHIVRCIALALDHAHKAGVVHRDLKPENILGTIEQPLLTDFGIAKEVDHSLGLTRTGQVIGTLDYMSPEQATDAKTVDHRSDIYSLGVVLYEFATQGHLPYIHLAEREACLAAIRSDTSLPKWPRDHMPEFPHGLERIILKAMAHDPDGRYQEMSELLNDLDRFARGEWISPVGRIQPRVWLRYFRSRHPRIVYGVPAAILVILLIWTATQAARWLDPKRGEWTRQLDRIAAEVEELRLRRRQQLDPATRANLTELLKTFGKEAEGGAFGAVGDDQGHKERQDEYPDIWRRTRELSAGVVAHRWLKCDFLAGAEEAEEALRQLGLAAGAKEPPWTLTEHGLEITSDLIMDLQPYGQGLIYLILKVQDAPGFACEIRDLDDETVRTRIVQRERSIVVEQHRDDGFAVIDRRPLRPAGQETVAIEVSAEGVRSFWPREAALSDHPALREDRAAQVVLRLPQGAVLQEIEIWPESPDR